jgi:DNA polymerase I
VNQDNKYVPGIGPIGARLMILGEAPALEEIAAGKPFVGASGRELDKLLKDSGINRSDCWITNVCKYYVPPNIGTKKIPFNVRAEQANINLHEQLNDLQNEINSIRPNCILALGGTALWALCGKTKITNYRGSILHGMGCKFVSTYHPAHLLHQAKGEIKGYWARQVMIFDFKRALEESFDSKLELPSRTLSVCRNSAQLYDFKERYKGYDKPAIDIEALNCIPSCIGIAFTPYEGISVPLWNHSGISTIPDSDLVSIWILLSEILDQPVIGQNFKYDEDKISRLGFKISSLASDTMLKAFTINPELPKSLAFNTSIYTREPYYKDEGSDFDISKQSIDDLYIYNARDACVTKEIDLAMDSDIDELGLRSFYDNFIMKLHPLYLDIENEGFTIDIEKRNELLRKYIKWSEGLNYELFRLVGDEINVNSPKQVFSLLFDNLKLPRREGTGEEEITALLNNQSSKLSDDNRRILEIILEKRRVDKTINTYMMALPDYDNKMKTTYFLCLETGRTSTGQQEPPIRPIFEYKDIDNKKKKKALGIAFQTITKHGDIGEDVRSQFIPEKGHVFIQADSSQAEARVVFNLAEDYQALKDIDEHDYHALTASWFFGGTESDYSKKVLGYESPIRFAGKTLRHAGHLGAGKRRAATELNTQARKYKIPIQITEAIAEKSLRTFHARQPKIQQVFHNGIIKALQDNQRVLTAPIPYGIDSPIGGKRTFYERWGDELFRMAFSYIPQRAVSDNTKAAALRVRSRIHGIRIIVESHDALLFSIAEREVDAIAPIIKEEFERPIRFEDCSLPRENLVIPCELEIGYNYQELSKFKFMVNV